MEIRIDGNSDVPIRRQLAEQIVFQIVTERLKTGEFMPSVRELARRLKVHHNTISDAYQDLVRENWLVRRRGSRLVVISRDGMNPSALNNLDDLINMTIRLARETGYSMQTLRARVRERLLAEAPDHLLVVEQDSGLRELITEELKVALQWPVEHCSRDHLVGHPGLAIGALAVTAQHALAPVDAVFCKDRPAVPVTFSVADEHLDTIRNLRKPCVIAVVSASEIFLKVARSVLAPAIGNRHEVREVLLSNENASVARAADLVFCDSIAKRRGGLPKAVHYRLISPESLDYIDTAMKSYRERASL
jgi:DNA-binding transcriptional regulator YhcF (GntR family)